MKGHKIKSVEPGSIAEELEIEPGDVLLKVNDQELKDIFDYHYLCNDEDITVLIEKPDGEQWELDIEKDYNEDIGINFEQGLMDNYHSCRNKCMFCFIDQMPPGMRETLYFKDDDARLSFLQGNYITLTNMKEEDLNRIIKYRLSPINISVHTVNPELRNKMLHNRFAGEAMDKIKKLYDNRIEMNSQIVLCKGINDGLELERSIEYLSNLLPYMESLSVVPVGLTKFREKLYPLEKFTKKESIEVLKIIHKWQDKLLKEYGTRFVFASDEWYLKAEMPIPDADYYEGYGQLENGVGMIRSLTDEYDTYISSMDGDGREKIVSLATGVLAYPIIKHLAEGLSIKYPNVKCHVYEIQNDFFGQDITVAGLLTGQDIINQLKGQELGDYLILPDVLLRSGEPVLLDDLTIDDLQKALQKEIRIVKSDGASFIDTILN